MVLRQGIARDSEPHGRAEEIKAAALAPGRGSVHGANNRRVPPGARDDSKGHRERRDGSCDGRLTNRLTTPALGAGLGTGTAGDGDYGSSAAGERRCWLDWKALVR